MKTIDWEDLKAATDCFRQPFHDNYYAMYSSVYGGVVTDPLLMTVPADDHLVHRGDGVFETFKCVGGALYNVWAHLERLQASAEAIHLALPVTLKEMVDLTVETAAMAGRADALVRVLVSRGSGSYGVNPYECPKSHLYITISKLGAPFMRVHPEGARMMTSAIPAKAPFWARIKSCNYLPNVLMKKESVDAGVDFVVSFDENNHLAEGATENVGIVASDGCLRFPRTDGILRGTTMVRVAELANTSIESGLLRVVNFGDIHHDEILEASEVIIVGTTHNVLSVCEFDGQRIGDGRPGPVGKRLDDLLHDDMLRNPAMRTEVPGLVEGGAPFSIGGEGH